MNLPCFQTIRRVTGSRKIVNGERHKGTIIRLYMHKGYTLNKVMEFMESNHHFKAT